MHVLSIIIMATIWLNDPGESYNQVNAAAPAYLQRQEDRLRFERLRQCRMLYQSAHKKFFLEDARTQFRYPQEDIQGVLKRRYLTVNLLKAVANTTADLLFGGKPKIEATKTAQTDRIDELVRRSNLYSRLHECAVQMSWAGGAFLEATVWGEQVYIEVVPADEIYPRGAVLPNGQYAAYVRYAKEPTPAGDKMMLLETTYAAGVISRRLRELDDSGQPAGEDLPLDRWPAFKDRVPQPVENTGIARNTIVYVANKAGESVGVSDFDGLVELQDAVNAKRAQLARVLEMNLDPKMWFPDEGTAGPEGNVRISDKAFFGGGAPPQYVVWQAMIDGAIKDLSNAVLDFCATAELSPVLLGIKQGATPEAARKLRLEATKDLSRTGRKALLVEPAIALVVEIALELEQSTPLLKSFPMDPVGVHLRDGLPVDPKDIADEAMSWASTNSISLEDLVAMRVEDPDAAAIEVERIRQEKKDRAAEMTPSVLMQEPGQSGPIVGEPASAGGPAVGGDQTGAAA